MRTYIYICIHPKISKNGVWKLQNVKVLQNFSNRDLIMITIFPLYCMCSDRKKNHVTDRQINNLHCFKTVNKNPFLLTYFYANTLIKTGFFL